MFRSELQQALADHLRWWGLKRVLSDGEYDAWQGRSIAPADLATLNRLATARTAERSASADAAFYDFSARENVLPVLYSQRYDYYMAIGPLVAERIGAAESVLDFGCGPGILTTFYALTFPLIRFTGVDRSRVSIAAARDRAERLKLPNVEFHCADVLDEQLDGRRYDTVTASHAVLQAEQDPGVPSTGWWSFDRSEATAVQREFEQRTGLGARLDALGAALPLDGRLILFEKARQLGRRIPFQRALAARGWHLIEPPLPIRYVAIEDVTEDGPLLVVSRGRHDPRLPWSEEPEWVNGDDLQAVVGKTADYLLARLPERIVHRSTTWRDSRYGMLAVEDGLCAPCFGYLFLKGRSRGTLLIGPREAMARVGPDTAAVHAMLTAPSRPVPDSLMISQPLYENHTPWAERVWAALPDRIVRKETTRDGAGGRQWHAEQGTSAGIPYLYCANTYDQRQLVVAEPARADLVARYYDDILAGAAGGESSET